METVGGGGGGAFSSTAQQQQHQQRPPPPPALTPKPRSFQRLNDEAKEARVAECAAGRWIPSSRFPPWVLRAT
jgi:hypothetical protein